MTRKAMTRKAIRERAEAMFRLTAFLRRLTGAAAPARTAAPAGGGAGPVVIWNLTRQCNLRCRHCYNFSAEGVFPDELSTAEILRVMADLRAFRVPVLILSGGEPLRHPDIHRIGAHARQWGFYTSLSSNGTLITPEHAAAMARVGYDYVGISLDGLVATHDRFRGREGAFAAALDGVRRVRDAGLKTGLRFTLTQENAADLPALLALMTAERIDKFYLSHLNYAGRGNRNRQGDARRGVTRRCLEGLFAHALADIEAGGRQEFVTGNNDADAACLLLWARERFPPDRVAALTRALVAWGGNASGVAVANIDSTGHVHPDSMWGHCTLGNVRQQSFAAIWEDRSSALMAGLAQRPRPVKGRCAGCAFLPLCNGNARVRAEQVFGDPWAEDPGCTLDDGEIADSDVRRSVAAAAARVWAVDGAGDDGRAGAGVGAVAASG